MPVPNATIVRFGCVVPPEIVWPTASDPLATALTVRTFVAIEPVKVAMVVAVDEIDPLKDSDLESTVTGSLNFTEIGSVWPG